MTLQDKTYERFDRATKNLQAYCIIGSIDGSPNRSIGRIVIKYGAICRAFVHIWNHPMIEGTASGYGYDKESAAVSNAIGKMHEMNIHILPNFKDGQHWRSIAEITGFTFQHVLG